jgi:hypothetical protein
VEPTTETAPVIPAVETTEPLSTEVAAAAPATVEPTEAVAAPATNGESSKKEVKSDKRKSSLPLFGKKEKAEGDAEAAPKSSPFSKLRNTIKVR